MRLLIGTPVSPATNAPPSSQPELGVAEKGSLRVDHLERWWYHRFVLRRWSSRSERLDQGREDSSDVRAALGITGAAPDCVRGIDHAASDASRTRLTAGADGTCTNQDPP